MLRPAALRPAAPRAPPGSKRRLIIVPLRCTQTMCSPSVTNQSMRASACFRLPGSYPRADGRAQRLADLHRADAVAVQTDGLVEAGEERVEHRLAVRLAAHVATQELGLRVDQRSRMRSKSSIVPRCANIQSR